MKIFIVIAISILLKTCQGSIFDKDAFVAWNRSLLTMPSNISEETTMLINFFNESEKDKSLSTVGLFRNRLSIYIADGSKSNYTKRIFLKVDLSSASTT